MPYLTVNSDGTELISPVMPIRCQDQWISLVILDSREVFTHIELPKGTIKQLIGKDLNWGSNPYEMKEIEHEETKTTKYPIIVKLIGSSDNAFNILSSVTLELRKYLIRVGETNERIEEITTQYKEEATSGDYENLLDVTSKWVEIA